MSPSSAMVTAHASALSGPALALAARSKLKRALDIVLALALLVAAGPLMLVTAAAVWLDSAGPVLFRQRRTGLGGREITILKFRTMLVQEDGDCIRQARRGDPRVTRVGSFLRRSSIDELPQLINVLRGDMSLVGPRPHALAHDTFYQSQIPTYGQRFRARPGITGLAQVSGLRGECPNIELMEQRIRRDIEYVDGWSIWLDLVILVRTVAVVPFQATAYAIAGLAFLLPHDFAAGARLGALASGLAA